MQGRNVYVREVGFHAFGRHPEKSLKQIAATAATAALLREGMALRLAQLPREGGRVGCACMAADLA